MHKFDELESLIRGIEFVADTNANECYYWENPLDEEKCCKVPWYVFVLHDERRCRCRTWSSACSFSEHHNHPPRLTATAGDGVQYPYLVVNMGSGISIVAVYGHNNFKRISGSR